MRAGIDEKSIRREDPKDLVLTLGYEKAKAILKKLNHSSNDDTYLITGDQVPSLILTVLYSLQGGRP